MLAGLVQGERRVCMLCFEADPRQCHRSLVAAALAERLERRMTLDVSVTDRHLWVTVGGATLGGEVERLALGA